MPAKASRDSVEGLVDSLLKGDKRSAGKLISLVEDDEPEAVEAVALIFPHTGRAHVVGLTGPPGVGKSSLINRLVRAFRSRGKTVGGVAVDPTSPYTGGAVPGALQQLNGPETLAIIVIPKKDARLHISS